jgi:hypothetical protein
LSKFCTKIWEQYLQHDIDVNNVNNIDKATHTQAEIGRFAPVAQTKESPAKDAKQNEKVLSLQHAKELRSSAESVSKFLWLLMDSKDLLAFKVCFSLVKRAIFEPDP